MTSLDTFLDQAFRADPIDRVIGPTGQGDYSTLFGIIPDALVVLRVAAEIERNPDEVRHWYTRVRIRELGNLTAQRLVAMGRADSVIAFLRLVQERNCAQ